MNNLSLYRCHAWLIGVLWLLTVSTSMGQTGTLFTGKVSDEKSQPLPGVTVLLKGTSNGTTTDATGTFRLSVSGRNATLVVSYVGYVTQEIPLTNQTAIDISLVPDNKTLNEIVVVGYGTQQKKDLTGSVVSVAAKDIQRLPVSRLDQALQGQVAGLQISTTTGAPGGNASILVRGIGSVSGGVEPLIVVDGFPGLSSLNAINSGDIESIEVLKDASATAIYGSRGSNGVIIVTTKKGKAGQSSITFDTYAGFQEPTKLLKLMNAKQFAQYAIDARNNGWLENGGPNAKITDPNSVRQNSYRIPVSWQDPNNLAYDTDWQKQIFRSAPIRNYQLSATGGTEKMRYALSGGYFDQSGILINTGFKRFTARLNAEGNPVKRLRIGMSLAPTYSNAQDVPSTGHFGDLNVINSAWTMPPMLPVYNADGSYANTFDLVNEGAAAVQNPVKIANELKSFNSQFLFQGNAFGEYEILDGLKLKVSVGTVLTYAKSSSFRPSTLSASAPTAPASANSNMSEGINWLNENTLNYRRSFGMHSIDALAGFTAQKATSTANSNSATNFPDDLIPNVGGGQVTGGNYTIGQWSLLSYLGRINYAYNDRYLLTATIRSDGSSRFGANNRWGTFPSFSAGYRISEENFLKNSRIVSDLKLRVSYGFSGNNDIGNYRAIGLLSDVYYVLGNTQVPGLSQSTFSNSNLGWETSKQLDIGLDFALFNNRLQFTGDYYNRRNTDMLLSKAIPSTSGYTSAWVNIGELENKGIELALTGRPVTGRNFQWSSSFNITFNKNKVLKLGSKDEQIFADGGRGNTNLTVAGRPIGSFYGHVYEGIFLKQEDIANHATQNGAKLGDIMYKDVDGNGVINDADRDFIGNPQPKCFYGFNNTFTYKNWSLNILMNGMQGNDVFWAGGVFAYGFHGVQNSLAIIEDNRWRSVDQPGDGKSPRAIRGGLNNNLRYSSFFVFKGSYLRVRNVTLNYNLPQGFARKISMQGARIYLTGTNLFTVTKYPGYDPEISNSGDNMLSAGIDYAGYPPARTITAGLSVTF